MRVVQLTTDNREPFRDHANPVPHFGPAPSALLAGFALLPEVEVHIVACVRQAVVCPEKVAPNLFYHGLVVPKIGWMRTLYQGCIRATRKKLREIQPDIVHGQGTERDCALSAVFGGFPNVLTIHGNMRAMAEVYSARPGSFHWVAGKLEPVALKRTAGVFCNSAYTEQMVAPLARRTWRVPNALRLDFFRPLPPVGKNPVPILLNIGMMEARKQQLEILAVAARLHARGLKFQIHFLGNVVDTDYGKKFRAALAAAERAGYARHLGMLPVEKTVAVLDAADALIHFPSEEAFGLVTAEALARNLKFFGSAVGGGVEIASGAELAELFPANDFTALENGVADWLHAGCPRPQNAAVLIRERYHPQVVARRHLEIYREVLAQKAA